MLLKWSQRYQLITLCLFVNSCLGVNVKKFLPITCKSDEFSCLNYKGRSACMPNHFKCDEKLDCLHLEDETDCYEKPINCTKDEFQCEHRKMCIDKRYRCDGHRGDCSDFSDEKDCPNKCDSNTRAMCFDKQICLEQANYCDGIADCVDGFDEFNCFKRQKDYGLNTGLQCPEKMIKCRNGLQCIQESFVCDGSSDCDDSSDEHQCEQARLCRSNDKICSNGICKPESSFCDGVEDCSDGSDEAHCPLKSTKSSDETCEEREYKCGGRPTLCISHERLCKTTAAGDDCRQSVCAQEMKFCDSTDPNCRCRPTYANGTVCYCPEGFKIKGKKCVDINECDIPGSCDQICSNLPGTFNCACHSGYQLYGAKGDGKARKCRVLGSNPLLLLSDRFSMRQFDLTTRRYHPLAANLSSDSVLDFWHANQTVFWSDSSNGQLISCQTRRMSDGLLNNLENCVQEGNTKDTNQQESALFHGIAVDWVHKLAFWSEISPTPTINVYDLSNSFYRVIIDKDMDQPKSIVLDPSAGLIFWFDLGAKARIERAGMNGGHRTVILEALKWPTALTIDILERQLYWADSKQKTIFSSNYYGQDVRTIVHSHNTIRHPFSMVVFEDRIFLSDRDQANILSMNRFDGSDVEILFTRLQGPTSLRVYQEQLQPNQRNLCSNHTCSQLCLPMASMRAKTPDKEINSETNPINYMCLCAASQRSDPSDPKECVQIDPSSDEYNIPNNKLKKRRSIFSTLAIMAMISLLLGATYYWWFVNRRPRYTNAFQQFVNPAFET